MSGPTTGAAATDQTLQLGLLMETAQTHQQLVEQALAALQSHTQGLDAVVRDQIHHSFVGECGALIEQAQQTAESLRALTHAVSVRFVWSAVACAVLCAVATLFGLARLLPPAAQLRALRAQRAQLTATIEQLQADGGRVELRRCGDARRLCVRIDRRSAAYGEAGDYFIVRGY